MRAAEVRVRRQDVEAEGRRQFEVAPETLRGGPRAGAGRGRDPDRPEELAGTIAALEPVKLIADEEYRELDERLTFLRAQHDDLPTSMKDLDRALRGMTRTAQERSSRPSRRSTGTSRSCSRACSKGAAPSCGWSRRRRGRPPGHGDGYGGPAWGKRSRRSPALGRGEGATGLALLFGIFDYRAETFCLLDEVDAPLDDANIHRFTRVLRELAGQTQFVVITHNRKTMEAADVLYGVTMEEPGLSRLVS